jgi:heme exporter protein A
MIHVRSLDKSFGYRFALRDINLDVGRGQSLALLGPNGAGKTTLVRILATLLKPSAGRIQINGLDAHDAGGEIRRHIGFLSHQSLLYGDLTVEENLQFYARLYGLASPETRITELLEVVGLSGRRNERARSLSRGMTQRLSLARALVHRPQLLLLDEPYTGLDRQAADTLTAMLHGMKQAVQTVVLTTHNLEQGLELSDTVAILDHGRLVFQAQTASMTVMDLTVAYRQSVGEKASPEVRW